MLNALNEVSHLILKNPLFTIILFYEAKEAEA